MIDFLIQVDGENFKTFQLAMCNYIESNPDCSCDVTSSELYYQYLVNQNKKDNEYVKLQLTRHDKDIFDRLIRKENQISSAHNLLNNYNYIYDFISSKQANIDQLYNGIAKLMIVEVSLEREYNDPQLIFESLNSTGAKLTQADLKEEELTIYLS
ncbi:MAG: DUF262 domain-containing protein [Clostridium sp.]|nr:DUF262 domain-containing protein [Clostridium sp.]